MWQRPFFHEGMSELQDRFDGRRVAEAIIILLKDGSVTDGPASARDG